MKRYCPYYYRVVKGRGFVLKKTLNIKQLISGGKKKKDPKILPLKPYLVKQRNHSPSRMICQKNVNKCWISHTQHNGNFTRFFIL